MMGSRQGKVLIGMLALFGILVALVLLFPKARASAAQDQIPGMSDGGGSSMMMPPFPGGNAAITAYDGSIYVVHGGMLYRFDAKTLAVQGKTSLAAGYRSGKSQSAPKAPGE